MPLLKFPDEISKIEAFIKEADASNSNRDARKLTDFQHLMLKRNPRLASHLNVRTTAVSAFSWDLIDEDPNRALAARQRCSEAITTVLKHHAITPFFGILGFTIESIADPLLGNVHKLKRIESGLILANKDEAFLASEDTPPKLSAIDLNSNSYLIDIGTSSILEDIAHTEFYRQMSLRENFSYLTIVKGLIQVIEKQAMSDDALTAANDAISTARNHQFISTTEDIEFKVNELTKANSEVFKDYIERCNNDIAIACLGQANTTEMGANGSRAALQVLKMISADIHYSDMLRVERLVNHLLLIDYRLNIDAAATVSPYKFEFNWEEDTDPEANARFISEALLTGLTFVRSEIYDRLGLTVPDGTTETVRLVQGILEESASV